MERGKLRELIFVFDHYDDQVLADLSHGQGGRWERTATGLFRANFYTGHGVRRWGKEFFTLPQWEDAIREGGGDYYLRSRMRYMMSILERIRGGFFGDGRETEAQAISRGWIRGCVAGGDLERMRAVLERFNNRRAYGKLIRAGFAHYIDRVALQFGGQVITGLRLHAQSWFGTGAEAIRNGIDITSAPASFRIDYRDWIDASWFVLHGGYAYNVISVAPQANGMMDLVCVRMQG